MLREGVVPIGALGRVFRGGSERADVTVAGPTVLTSSGDSPRPHPVQRELGRSGHSRHEVSKALGGVAT
jgi:hypothetical protein